jgi:anti-anti-sigma factor
MTEPQAVISRVPLASRHERLVPTRLGMALGHRGPGLRASSTVVELDGDLGIAAAQALREGLISLLRPGTRLVAVDLSRVQSCDPAGLAVLIGMQRRAREGGIVVCLVAPSPPVAELLRSTGLERCLTICPDLPAVLAWERGEPARAPATPQSLAG